MTTNYTPGPWRIEAPNENPAGSTRIIGATGAIVALMKAAGGRKAGNASIVAAAPAMLAALQTIADSEEYRGDSFVCDFSTLQNVARAILARIDGTAPQVAEAAPAPTGGEIATIAAGLQAASAALCELDPDADHHDAAAVDDAMRAAANLSRPALIQAAREAQAMEAPTGESAGAIGGIKPEGGR